MDTNADRALSNLYVLAALSHNDKLTTNDDNFDIDYPTTWRAILRTVYGERRSQNVERVRSTVRQGIDAAQRSLSDANALAKAMNESQTIDPQLLLRRNGVILQHLRMVDALTKARGGLDNLMHTYQDDAAHKSQICLVMEDIETFCAVIAHQSSLLRTEAARIGRAESGECDTGLFRREFPALP